MFNFRPQFSLAKCAYGLLLVSVLFAWIADRSRSEKRRAELSGEIIHWKRKHAAAALDAARTLIKYDSRGDPVYIWFYANTPQAEETKHLRLAPTIREVRICYSHGISGEVFSHLATLPKLETLRLEGRNCHILLDEHAEAISNLPSLKSVELDNIDVSEFGRHQISHLCK